MTKIILGLLMIISTSLAQEPRVNLNKDPYVRLYTQRVELARRNVSRQEARNRYLLARFTRAKIATEKGVASKEELDEALSQNDMGTEDLKYLQIRVLEMESVLEVVKFMVEKGREDIPLFPAFPSDVNR